jgi:hypothetical protein
MVFQLLIVCGKVLPKRKNVFYKLRTLIVHYMEKHLFIFENTFSCSSLAVKLFSS